jgi:hypothetical protein
MKTIETKPGVTIGFLRPPAMPTEVETNYRKYLYVNNTILHVYYIAKLSEIKEDQAQGLAEPVAASVDGKYYMDYTYSKEDFQNKVKFKKLNAVECIKSAALLHGIPEKEFDQYLVILL